MTQRIVSLIASATEIVCALGFEDQLVGRSHECDHPPTVARLPACSTSKVEVGADGRTIDGQVRAILHLECCDFGHRGRGWTYWTGDENG